MDDLGQPGHISTLFSYFTFLYFRSNIIITIKIIIRYARILPLLSLSIETGITCVIIIHQ